MTLVKVIKDNARALDPVGAEEINQSAQPVEDTKTTISRAYKSAARWQIITTTSLSLAVLVFASWHTAMSMLLGGISVLVGGYAAVATARRGGGVDPGVILIALLKAELVRILVIALLLLAVFKFYKGLVPLALIGGLAVAVLISGAGLRTLGKEYK